MDMLPILENTICAALFAIIGDLVGTTGYMTLAQLKDLVARGYECTLCVLPWRAGSLQNLTVNDVCATWPKKYNGLAKK